ncbi:MAG: hypothetical protein SFU91_02360 [Chloroherpetonaceae bacterium]|nr:hypothetical protein [Chloroherpetonaceae bacterium]
MRKFGEILLEEGFVTQEQMDKALAYQSMSQLLLGRVLVDLHFMTHHQQERVFEYQKQHHGKRFGECAIEMGIVTQIELDKAAEVQAKSKGYLGDLLIELGYLTPQLRDKVLHIQMSEINH